MAKLEILPKMVDVLEVNSPDSVLRINIDILNEAFGVGRGMFAKAVYPDKKNSDIPGTKPGDRFIIWMPKLYGNSSEWKNVISEDGTEIYEVAEIGGHSLLGRNGKILVLGASALDQNTMNGIAKLFGFHKKDFEYETDYTKVVNFAGRINNSERYAAIIF